MIKQVPLTKETVTLISKGYCDRLHQLETGGGRINERSIEYGFVFKQLTIRCPRTVLDIGTGMSSLPHMMSLCGFDVKAVDANEGSWPDGVFNRHFNVTQMDILKPDMGAKFDFITCISVLEHIADHREAVCNMLSMLSPGGCLAITCPFSSRKYVANAYRLPGSTYGQKASFICQIFTDEELESWGGAVIDREYWNLFSGGYWTVGKQNYPAKKVGPGDDYDLCCILMENK